MPDQICSFEKNGGIKKIALQIGSNNTLKKRGEKHSVANRTDQPVF